MIGKLLYRWAAWEKAGHTVAVIAPDQFAAFGCPGYPEVQLSIFPYGRLADLLDLHLAWGATAVHIATEGRWAGRRGGIAWGAATRQFIGLQQPISKIGEARIAPRRI